MYVCCSGTSWDGFWTSKVVSSERVGQVFLRRSGSLQRYILWSFTHWLWEFFNRNAKANVKFTDQFFMTFVGLRFFLCGETKTKGGKVSCLFLAMKAEFTMKGKWARRERDCCPSAWLLFYLTGWLAVSPLDWPEKLQQWNKKRWFSQTMGFELVPFAETKKMAVSAFFPVSLLPIQLTGWAQWKGRIKLLEWEADLCVLFRWGNVY